MKTHYIVIAAVLVSSAACKKHEDEPVQSAPRAGSESKGSTAASSAEPASTRSEKATAPVPTLPVVTKWEIDPENSSVNFVCKHAMHTNVRGMFQRPSGSIVLDEATPTNSKVSATIDIKLITTGVDERDTHLRGSDFFDSVTYPVATFSSTGVAKLSDTSYSVTGNLTMRGVTKPVTLAVTASPPFQHYGTIRRGIEATTSVNRTDFGVGVAAWNVPAESGGLLVGDNVEITIDAELVLQSDASKPGSAH